MNELTIILMSLLGNEDPGSTDYVIADYILKNVESLAKVSTSTLAENCNVSKASISRFCKKIGLEDFFELKYLIKKHLPGKIISQKYAFEGNNVTESLNF